jgi:hypothetical protein
MEQCTACCTTLDIIYVNALDFFDCRGNSDPLAAVKKRAAQGKKKRVMISFNSHTIVPMPITLFQFATAMPDNYYVAVCYPYTGIANIPSFGNLKLNRANQIRIFKGCTEAKNWLCQQDNNRN